MPVATAGTVELNCEFGVEGGFAGVTRGYTGYRGQLPCKFGVLGGADIVLQGRMLAIRNELICF